MRKIKLETKLEFGSRCDFDIIDVTDSTGKRRGTITIDYAPSDIEQLKAADMDLDSAVEYYRDRIYNLVKHYISGDWEDAGGYESALSLIRKHLESAFSPHI